MKISKELLKGSTTLLVLNLLNTGDMYGYQIIKEIEKKSENIFTLKEGTVYPILHELESKGMIESYWEDTESARKRKYYSLTDSGKKLLLEKHREWQIYSESMNKLIGGECIG